MNETTGKYKDGIRVVADCGMMRKHITVDQLKEATIDLVDEYFPKGQCKERGQALVLYGVMLYKIKELLEEQP